MKKSSTVFIFAVFIFCFSLICGAIPIQQCPRPQATMDEYFDEAKSENKLVAFVCCEKSNPVTNSEAFKKYASENLYLLGMYYDGETLYVFKNGKEVEKSQNYDFAKEMCREMLGSEPPCIAVLNDVGEIIFKSSLKSASAEKLCEEMQKAAKENKPVYCGGEYSVKKALAASRMIKAREKSLENSPEPTAFAVFVDLWTCIGINDVQTFDLKDPDSIEKFYKAQNSKNTVFAACFPAGKTKTLKSENGYCAVELELNPKLAARGENVVNCEIGLKASFGGEEVSYKGFTEFNMSQNNVVAFVPFRGAVRDLKTGKVSATERFKWIGVRIEPIYSKGKPSCGDEFFCLKRAALPKNAPEGFVKDKYPTIINSCEESEKAEADCFVEKTPFLNLKHVKCAYVEPSLFDGKLGYSLKIELTGEGKEIMGKTTENMVKGGSARNIAVVIDGKIVSLPFILSKVNTVNVYFSDAFEKARKYADMINECVSVRKLD